MAVVRSLDRLTTSSSRHPTEVEATYQVVRDGGEVLFQLTTYGSPERKLRGKGSQTLQFDRSMAERLVAALREAFPGL
jgi:hypothetical protein